MSHPLMKYFGFTHLPPHLQPISAPFHSLAQSLVDNLPDGGEKDQALRKLLEAKDCAVRAMIP